jgi:transcriptional regulator with XRE-family HTH domain
LEAIRELAGYTTEEAAGACGVSVEQMRDYENYPGNISAGTAMKLRRLYDIPLDYIDIE